MQGKGTKERKGHLLRTPLVLNTPTHLPRQKPQMPPRTLGNPRHKIPDLKLPTRIMPPRQNREVVLTIEHLFGYLVHAFAEQEKGERKAEAGAG